MATGAMLQPAPAGQSPTSPAADVRFSNGLPAVQSAHVTPVVFETIAAASKPSTETPTGVACGTKEGDPPRHGDIGNYR